MKDGDVAGLSAFQGDAALLSIVKEAVMVTVSPLDADSGDTVTVPCS